MVPYASDLPKGRATRLPICSWPSCLHAAASSAACLAASASASASASATSAAPGALACWTASASSLRWEGFLANFLSAASSVGTVLLSQRTTAAGSAGSITSIPVSKNRAFTLLELGCESSLAGHQGYPATLHQTMVPGGGGGGEAAAGLVCAPPSLLVLSVSGGRGGSMG
eukprot:scaffold151860_cov27-Tisochrysis_lutea.AAC.6